MKSLMPSPRRNFPKRYTSCSSCTPLISFSHGCFLAEEEISSQVRQFIANYIPSVARLEILLLLKTNASQIWTPDSIARELRIDPRAAAEQLAALQQYGFLEPSQAGFRYAAGTSELDADVIALAQAYLVRRVTVIGLIFSRSSDAIRSFSDSFKLRRDPPHA